MLVALFRLTRKPDSSLGLDPVLMKDGWLGSRYAVRR